MITSPRSVISGGRQCLLYPHSLVAEEGGKKREEGGQGRKRKRNGETAKILSTVRKGGEKKRQTARKSR